MSNSSDLSLRLEPGILNVVTLRLLLDRGDGKQEEITARCHTYYMNSESSVVLQVFMRREWSPIQSTNERTRDNRCV